MRRAGPCVRKARSVSSVTLEASLAFNIEHLPGPAVDALWSLASRDLVAWCLLAAIISAGVNIPRSLDETVSLLAAVARDGADALSAPVRADRRVAEVIGWVEGGRLQDAAALAADQLRMVL